MISRDLDRLITTWLVEDADEALPDYVDETIARIDRTRQRPAWLSPRRWLPMELTLPRVYLPRIFVYVAMVVLLVVVLAAGVLLIAGNQRRLPPPFGPASTGLIAFDAGGDIFVADADGTNRRPIASTAADEFGPAWSRDGTRLAYWSVDATSGAAGIVVADADGRVERVIGSGLGLRADERGWAPAWSPDGRTLLVATDEGTLYRIDRDGTNARQLGPRGDGVGRFYPVWSPDGTTIAFVFGGPTGGNVHVMNADGGGDVQVGKDWSGGPMWSPDGSRLAYWSPVDDGDIVVATDRGGTWSESAVVDGPEDDVAPSWSNDGTRLAFLRLGSQERGGLMVVAATGGTPRAIPTGAGTVMFGAICWTPDDRSVVALSDEPDAAYVVAPVDARAEPVRIRNSGVKGLDACTWQRLPN